MCLLSNKNCTLCYYSIMIELKDIQTRLREEIKNSHLSQKEIADICCISQTTYSNYELGIYLINTTCIYTIAKKYKLSIDKILGRK